MIGVNTFINPNPAASADTLKLARSTDEEKNSQIESLAHFQRFHLHQKDAALNQLRQTCLAKGNLFETLMEVVKVCSLGQISAELYRLGGQYRRNM